MCPTRTATALALAAATLVMPGLASAGCSTTGTGARCVSAPVRASAPAVLSDASAPSLLVAVGDVLERGEHSILLNAAYYGLPSVADGWVYMRIGPDLYRVDWRSQEVLERVTERAAANF